MMHAEGTITAARHHCKRLMVQLQTPARGIEGTFRGQWLPHEACNHKHLLLYLTAVLHRAGRQGELRFSPAPPAASTVGEQYSQGLTVEVFQDGFWGYPAGPFSPRVAGLSSADWHTNG